MNFGTPRRDFERTGATCEDFFGQSELRLGGHRFTSDGSLAAHFEHTIAVTDDGPEVLTLP